MYSFQWLCGVMRRRVEVEICSGGRVYRGIINGIRAEDGSGTRWLVRLHTGDEVYVRAE